MTDRAVAVLLAAVLLAVAGGDAAGNVPAGRAVPARDRATLDRRWPIRPSDDAAAAVPVPAATAAPQRLPVPMVHAAPNDARAWQRIATAQYVAGDVRAALGSWNRNGEPHIAAVAVHGATHTPARVLVRATGLTPQQVLTPETFRRALRRLRDVPVASSATMSYQAVDGGRAIVDLAIHERRMVPSGWRAVGTAGARALFLNELRLDVAGALGGGEVASAAWRWAAGRPRVSLGLAFPSPGWLPVIVSIDGSWERQSYEVTPTFDAKTVVHEERIRAGVRVSDWATSWLRVQAGTGVDHLREYADIGGSRAVAHGYLAVDSSVSARLAADRLAVTASGGWWTPLADGRRFGTGGLLASWQSTDDTTASSWSAVAGIGAASRWSPLAIWQGAGTGQGRTGLLRAHRLINSGVVDGPVFGRVVAHGSFEYTQPVTRTRAGFMSVAGFVDAAQAWHRLYGLGTSPLYVDAGAGLRVQTPGPDGALRIDVAHGLRGGGFTVSASWGGAWRR